MREVEHALRHGVDTKLPTDGDDCAERCDTYSGYLTEVGKWAHLPGGAVTLVGGVPLPAGVQAKPPGKRKAQEGHSEEADAELDDDEQSHGLRGVAPSADHCGFTHVRSLIAADMPCMPMACSSALRSTC